MVDQVPFEFLELLLNEPDPDSTGPEVEAWIKQVSVTFHHVDIEQMVVNLEREIVDNNGATLQEKYTRKLLNASKRRLRQAFVLAGGVYD